MVHNQTAWFYKLIIYRNSSSNDFDCFPDTNSITQPLKGYTDALLCSAITEELPAHPHA